MHFYDCNALLHRHRLRQVPRLVHIAASRDRCVVGEELERDAGEERAEDFGRRGDVEDVVGVLLNVGIALGGDGEDTRVAGAYLLNVAYDLLVDVRGGCDCYQRHVGIE